ncbi:MAG: ATP-binding cassette domain-containing protein [Lachnospiraceae bacterium]|nr:ATP-binding cassette domain-containing protein [Lachnospiraceae bacterium]
MIEVTNLTKKYGNHVAVDNLSFKVEKGQIYGFLGPNGAGKSTTMNIITGYLAATSGDVTINGIDIKKDPEEAKKCIGYLPEQPPLYLDMTVKEYLGFVAELKKVPAKERREQIRLVMEMTQIQDMQERLIKNLSKGYRQRVGLAQAILGFPEVIILDEPTVGLDPKQIIEIRDLIKNLAKNHTVILSSHILSEISAVCDHVMIISKGRLVASDTAEGLQQMMGGKKGELKLTVKGSQEQVCAALAEVTAGTVMTCREVSVGSVIAAGKVTESATVTGEEPVSGAQQDVLTSIQMETTGGTDIREAIFYALAEKRLPILEMSLEEKSLEDIFLELTGDDSAEAGSADEAEDMAEAWEPNEESEKAEKEAQQTSKVEAAENVTEDPVEKEEA